RLDREVGREGWLPSLVVLAGVPRIISVGPRIAVLTAAAATVAVFGGLAWLPAPEAGSSAAVPALRDSDVVAVHAAPIGLATREPAAAVHPPEQAPTPGIAGLVVDEDGGPFEGARVQTFRIAPADGGRVARAIGELERPVIAEAVTNAEGHFSLDAS